MDYIVKCSACKRSSNGLLEFKCSSCESPLAVHVNIKFETKAVQKKCHSLWRYARFFPYVDSRSIITLGEGWTPLIKFSRNLHFKLENLNPTGSFKDRGSAVLISALHKLIKKADSYIAEDSSGNAGASMAAYAARVGLKAKIYVPENVSGPKFNQIKFYGADVVKVSGGRSRVAEEAQRTERGKVYVGHILHPLFRDGIRSLAYEIAEQFDRRFPERIYLPVSAGTLLLGVIDGFKHLLDAGVIEGMPKVVACQTKQVSPLYHKFKNLHYTPPKKISSIADALVSVNPPLLDVMVKSLKEADGDAVLVEENEIFDAFVELARKGFFVEPSSAVAYAAYKKQIESGEVQKGEKSVVVLTGTGLKTALKPI
ncbi:MAG: pyridoxal-phosphate dependent enzyme [Candidatus Bathyarchaeia archaeon]